jgi:ferredoxin
MHDERLNHCQVTERERIARADAPGYRLEGAMSMKLNGRARIVVGIVVGLGLIAVTVIAAHEIPRAEQVAVAPEQPECSGQCANCPLAGTEECPAGNCSGDAEAVAEVNADRCIGCGRCVHAAPEAYRMNSETGKAEVIEGAPAEAVERGAEACPVGAIDR